MGTLRFGVDLQGIQDQVARRALEAIVEAIEVREGIRGGGKERFLTADDLHTQVIEFHSTIQDVRREVASSKYTPNADTIVRSILENLNVAEPPIHLNRPTVFDAKTGTDIGLGIGSSGIMAWNGPGDPTTTPTIRTVVISAVDGSFAFGKVRTGGDASHQIIFDAVNDTFFIGRNIKVETVNQTLATIADNANFGATRPVGDYTADILSNSGTTIQGFSSTLFKFVNGVYELNIGAGGIFAKKNGATTFSIDGATGSPFFAGDISTSGIASFLGGGTPIGGGGQYCSVLVSGSKHGLWAEASSTFNAGYFRNNNGSGDSLMAQTNTSGTGRAFSAYSYNGAAAAHINNTTGGVALDMVGSVKIGGSQVFDPAGKLANASLPGHSHWVSDIYPDCTSAHDAKFQYSTDGTTWTNIWLRRCNW